MGGRLLVKVEALDSGKTDHFLNEDLPHSERKEALTSGVQFRNFHYITSGLRRMHADEPLARYLSVFK